MTDDEVPVKEAGAVDENVETGSTDQWGIEDILEDENPIVAPAEALADEVRAAVENNTEESWSENQFEEEVQEVQQEDSWLNEEGLEDPVDEPVLDEENEESVDVAEIIEQEVSTEDEVIVDDGEDEVVDEEAEVESNEENVELSAGDMVLGTRRDDGSSVVIPSQVLARHAAMLGSTGSGKVDRLRFVEISLINDGCENLIMLEGCMQDEPRRWKICLQLSLAHRHMHSLRRPERPRARPSSFATEQRQDQHQGCECSYTLRIGCRFAHRYQHTRSDDCNAGIGRGQRLRAC